MIARLAPSIPLVRRTAAIGVVSLFVTRLAKVGNPPNSAYPDGYRERHGWGHGPALLLTEASGRCRLGQETFARTSANG